MIIPYYPWSGDEKTGASGDPRRSCGNTASNSTRAARLRPPPSKKMSENLTRWEVWRMQRLRRNIRRVETGMVFVVWALRNCLQGWVVRNLSRGFLCVCPRHLSQEQHANNAFTSTSSVHFLEFWGGRKTYNERKKLSKLYKHTPTHIQWIRSIFLVLGDFPVEDRERSFSLWRVLCEEHNWFLRTPIPKTRGKCRRPTCADDILKSYGGVVSCPSYSKANMWRRRRGCLVAQSCPSWLGESPREVYLIWCWRRNKQINGTLLHNTLLPFPLHCIPSVIAALATETITTRKRKGTNAAHGQLMVGASRVSRLSLIFSPKVKLRQCDHFNFQGPVWILSVWMAGSTFIKTEWGLLQNGNISANLWGRHVVKSLCSKLHNFIF